MLQHYSPYKVAEQFRVLSALAPGRVALGVGKAPGGFQLSTDALQRELIQPARLFEEKLEELTHFIRNDFPDSHCYASLRPAPHTEYAPDLFCSAAARKARYPRPNSAFPSFSPIS